MTELNNVCACARLWRGNPILSFARGDFLFRPFEVLFVRFAPKNGPQNSMDSFLSSSLRTGIITSIAYGRYIDLKELFVVISEAGITRGEYNAPVNVNPRSPQPGQCGDFSGDKVNV